MQVRNDILLLLSICQMLAILFIISYWLEILNEVTEELQRWAINKDWNA